MTSIGHYLFLIVFGGKVVMPNPEFRVDITFGSDNPLYNLSMDNFQHKFSILGPIFRAWPRPSQVGPGVHRKNIILRRKSAEIDLDPRGGLM